MGILDWFKNRPGQFDPDRVSAEMVRGAVEKAMTLTNPPPEVPAILSQAPDASRRDDHRILALARSSVASCATAVADRLVFRSGLAGIFCLAVGHSGCTWPLG